jgi:hypothetical protein
MPQRFSMRLPRSLWTTVLTGVAMVLVCCFAWALSHPGRQFDRELWVQYSDLNKGSQYPRLAMADRLTAEGTLLGKNPGEIVEMLGEPPDTEYFSDWDVVYWLGPERGFMSIDSEWLVVRFDAQGGVAECRIVRD